MPIQDGWALDIDSRDPSIPNLPLETPAAGAPTAQDAAWFTAQRARRTDTVRTHLAPPLLHLDGGAPAASQDGATDYAPFKTFATRGRTSRTAKWSAALAPAQQAAVVPAAAWFSSPYSRRSTTERTQITVEPLQWEYIAPTVAAIIPSPVAKVVWFERHIQLPLPLAVYPPPVGPPSYFPAWDSTRTKQVSQRRRLQRLLEQPSYSAASPSVSSDNAATESFQTRRSRGRRLLAAPPAPVYPQASAPVQTDFPATVSKPAKKRKSRRGIHLSAGAALIPIAAEVPSVYPAQVPVTAKKRKSRRGIHLSGGAALIPVAAEVINVYPAFVTSGFHKVDGLSRRHLTAPPAPVYPAPAAPPAVTFSAVADPRRLKRRGRRGGLLLGGGGDDVFLQPGTTTAAVYPSFLPTGHYRRVATDYRQVRNDYPPVYPVASVTTSTDYSPGESFQTRISRGRKMLRTADPLGVNPAPPPPLQYAAVVAAKPQRRPGPRGGLLLFVEAVVSNPAQPEQAWRAPVQHFQSQDRTFQLEPFQPDYPQTPPSIAPLPAFLPTGYLRRQDTARELLPADPQLLFPETPPAPPETPRRRGGGRPNRPPYTTKKPPRLNQQIVDLVESVSAELAYKAVAATAPPSIQEEAKALIQPYAATDVDNVDWAALESDARAAGELLRLWAAEKARLKRIRDDDEWFMWEG